MPAGTRAYTLAYLFEGILQAWVGGGGAPMGGGGGLLEEVWRGGRLEPHNALIADHTGPNSRCTKHSRFSWRFLRLRRSSDVLRFASGHHNP